MSIGFGNNSRKSFPHQKDMPMKNKRFLLPPGYCLAAAFITLLICSKSSPLYPLNDWVDANTYLTVGRGMLHGRLPYRDLYEQKGPLLYMLHAGAAAVSERSFLGVFIIEVIACTAFLYEASVLFSSSGSKSRLWLVTVISGAVYASRAFCHGDSAEELCLPLTLGAYMLGLAAVRGKRPLSGREWFTLGILGGAVLWIKFTLTGIFAAPAAAGIYYALRQSRGGGLVRGLSLCVLGAAAASLPVITYFAVNGALDDLFSVYFYDNIFRYGGTDGGFPANLGDGLNFCRIFMPLPSLIICAGLVLIPLREGKASALYFTGAFTAAAAAAFGGHASYQYYPLAAAVFVPHALTAASGCIKPVRSLPRYLPAAVCSGGLILCGLWCSLTSRNVYLMKYSRSELPQYRFAEIVRENGGGSLLNYGFIDGGFYLAAGQIPEFRYFCLNNMDIPEMRAAQEHYISSGRAKFAVMRSASQYPEYIPEGFSLISTSKMCYYDKLFYYFLFICNENDKTNTPAIE